MPQNLGIALRFLYAFTFVWLCLMGKLLPFLHWVDVRWGIWVTVACFCAYIVVARIPIVLINKINRDWPTLDLPPRQMVPVAEIEEVFVSADTGERQAQGQSVLTTKTNDSRDTQPL